MSTPTSWNGKIPSTATEVAELQNKTFSLRRKGKFSRDFFQDSVLRMMNLRDRIRAEEEKFYSQFNLPKGPYGLEVLQQRLNELNSDPGFRSMSNISDSSFDELVSLALTKTDLFQPIEAFFNDDKISEEFLSSKAIQEEVDIPLNEFIDKLNNIYIKTHNVEVKTKNGRLGSNRINKSKSGDYGLSKYIGKVVIKPTEEQKQRIEISFRKGLPLHWQERLLKDYNLFIDNGVLNRHKILQDWLSRYIANPRIKEYVMYQFDHKKDSYDLNSSIASIKGFLGEVKASAFLDYLANQKGAAIPTGKIQKLINQKASGEITIDILLREFGFQIKNYRVIKGKTTFIHQEDIGMGTFIVNRLRPEQGISQLLQSFFGSWSFNQPIEEATERYHQIYGRFDNANFDDIFNGYLDNILKISDVFQAEMKEFAEYKLYFNTFFLIGDRFVSSSSMITAIIQSLQAAEADRAFTSSYSITPTSFEGRKWSYEEPQPEEATFDLANYTNINWRITLDINKILDYAYTQLEQF